MMYVLITIYEWNSMAKNVRADDWTAELPIIASIYCSCIRWIRLHIQLFIASWAGSAHRHLFVPIPFNLELSWFCWQMASRTCGLQTWGSHTDVHRRTGDRWWRQSTPVGGCSLPWRQGGYDPGRAVGPGALPSSLHLGSAEERRLCFESCSKPSSSSCMLNKPRSNNTLTFRWPWSYEPASLECRHVKVKVK